MRQRAPFVWLASQPIVDDGRLGLDHDTAPRDDGENRFVHLRRDFTLAAVPDRAEVALTSDGRYQLWINGAFVGRGPARSDPMHKRVDRHTDIARHLRAGANTIAVLVRCYGRDNAFYMMPPDAWRLVFGDGGLWLDARLGELALTTDSDWRALRSPAWVRDTPPMMFALGPIEAKDGRAEPVGWTEPGFDDSEWERCVVQRIGGGGPEAPWAGRWVEPFPLLVEREIPFAAEADRAPTSVRWVRSVTPRPDLPIERRLYDEVLGDPEPTGAAEALTRGEAWTVTTGGRDMGALFDFGRIHAGHPFIEVEANGGEVIELAVAERLPDEFVQADAGPNPDARITPHRSWHGHDAHIARYVCRPGRQRFERFDWSAVKYLQLAVRDAPAGLRITALGSRETHYPVEDRGAFTASDPLLAQIWEVGKRTLTACMHDAWIDCPSREARQWLGDVAVEYPTASVAFGPGVAPLARQFLRHVAESQHADGLTEMFAPGDHRHGLVRIPDWSIMWLLVAHQHWRLTGDLATPALLLGQLERVLDWFARFKGPGGLVADLPYWRFVDWAGIGRDGESAVLNALYVAGCRAVADLSHAVGDQARARRWRDEAHDVAAILAERHWDVERGVYVDMVDPATGECRPRVSQHANMAFILWDIAPRDRWDGMIAWCLDPARVKVTRAPEIVPDGEPVDEASDCVSANTFFAHFVYEALAKAGRVELVLAEIRRRYGPMIAAGATTLWESYSPAASLCHGFSAAPLWQFSASVLGIRPAAPGYEKVHFSPDLGDLDSAEGTVPTVVGDIAVTLRRNGVGAEASIVAQVSAPAGVTIEPRDSGRLRFTGPGETLGPGRTRYILQTTARI